MKKAFLLNERGFFFIIIIRMQSVASFRHTLWQNTSLRIIIKLVSFQSPLTY